MSKAPNSKQTAAVDSPPLESLGLGGDGDEIDAIIAVETRFGVGLDDADAAKWVTAGDVFASLLNVLPPDQYNSDALWRQFTEAITEETGVDSTRVTRNTLLLGIPVQELVGSWIKRLSRGIG